jgi:hypothetical protein
MRIHLVLGLGLLGCSQAAGPVTFGRAAMPAELEVETRHRLELALGVGVGDEVETQRVVEETSVRARVERHQEGTVVRWLRHDDEGVSGRSVLVDVLGARWIDDRRPVAGALLTQARALEQVARGPNALQVALMESPLNVQERAAKVDEVFGALAAAALGSSVEVQRAAMRLSASTDGVAVFDTELSATSTSGPVAMELELRGTVEVRREDTMLLGFSLEGPVVVDTPGATTEDPAVQGRGVLFVSRRMRPTGSGAAAMTAAR